MDRGVHGSLDLPANEKVVAGSAVLVAGWVWFPGAQLDYVDVYVNGMPVGRASVGHVRRDVAGERRPLDVDALTSGFSMFVPLPPRSTDTEYVLHARATSVDRRRWESPARIITARAPRAKSHPPLEPSPVGLVAPDPEVVGASEQDRDRLALVAFTHSLALGGGELYLQELLLRIKEARDARILVVSSGDGPLRAELEETGIRVHITDPYTVDAGRYGGRLTELVSLIRQWDAHAVLVNTLGSVLAADAGVHAGLPTLWAIHESFGLDVFSFLAFGEDGLAPAVRERWFQVLQQAELVYEADATLELHAAELPGARARRIDYGIDLTAVDDYMAAHDRDALRARLGFAPSDRILLCMGVIQERKAQIALFRAFYAVADLDPNAKLVLVGGHDGAYPKALRLMIDDLDVGDRVQVIDVDKDTYQWYRAADVLVSASEVESLPRSILEAQRFGLPVVAADVFGVGAVVQDGINGWLFEPLRASAMRLGLARVLRCDDAELKRLSRAARASSDAHDGAGYPAAYLKLIDELRAGSEQPRESIGGAR